MKPTSQWGLIDIGLEVNWLGMARLLREVKAERKEYLRRFGSARLPLEAYLAWLPLKRLIGLATTTRGWLVAY